MIMKNALPQLFLCKHSMSNPDRTAWQSPLGKRGSDRRPAHYSVPGSSLQPSVNDASVGRGLIFPPSRFILIQIFNPWLLNQEVMPPLQDSREDHRQRKISGNIVSKQKLILFCRKKCPGVSHERLERSPWEVLRPLGAEFLRAPENDLKIAIDPRPDSQPLPVAPGATSTAHD
jgi:hypothetical protein